MRLNDALFGGILVAFAAALAWWSQSFPPIPGQQYGAAVFPTLVAIGFAGCGIVMIVSGIRAGGPAIALTEWVRERHGVRNVVATILAVLFYILLSRRLGFMLAMAPILLVLLRIFGVGWLMSVLVSAVVVLVMQYAFGDLLFVPLPWGLLAPFRW